LLFSFQKKEDDQTLNPALANPRLDYKPAEMAVTRKLDGHRPLYSRNWLRPSGFPWRRSAALSLPQHQRERLKCEPDQPTRRGIIRLQASFFLKVTRRLADIRGVNPSLSKKACAWEGEAAAEISRHAPLLREEKQYQLEKDLP